MHRSSVYSLIFTFRSRYKVFSALQEAPSCSLTSLCLPSLTGAPYADFCHYKWSLAKSWVSYKWNHTIVYILIWFCSLNIMSSRFYTVLYLEVVHSFKSLSSIQGMNKSQIAYSFYSWWTYGLFLLLATMSKCYKWSCTWLLMDVSTQLFGLYRSWMLAHRLGIY